MAELTPGVLPAKRRRSPLVVLAIVLTSIAMLYFMLVLLGGMGWDGY